MSHFSVLVIGDNPEKQLNPYQENNNDDCPSEYMEFNDVEEQYRKEYENDTSSEFYADNREDISSIDMNLLANTPIGENVKLNGIDMGFMTHEVKNGKTIRFYPNHKEKSDSKLEEVFVKIVSILRGGSDLYALELTRIEPPKDIPHKERYKDFDTFIKDWASHEKDENGRYGYYENPNAKWDWYQVGGRWSGMLKLKPNAESGTNGEKSWTIKDKKIPSDYVDSALKKDIDFEGMMTDTGNEYKKRYEQLERLCGGQIPTLPYQWKRDFIDEGAIFGDLDIEEKREKYHIQTAKTVINDILQTLDKDKDSDDYSLLTWIDLEDYQCTKKEYIEVGKNNALQAFAVLKDGEWFEKGQMGWFGVAMDEKEQNDWDTEITNLLKSVDGDTLITIVDCHI